MKNTQTKMFGCVKDMRRHSLIHILMHLSICASQVGWCCFLGAVANLFECCRALLPGQKWVCLKGRYPKIPNFIPNFLITSLFGGPIFRETEMAFQFFRFQGHTPCPSQPFFSFPSFRRVSQDGHGSRDRTFAGCGSGS